MKKLIFSGIVGLFVFSICNAEDKPAPKTLNQQVQDLEKLNEYCKKYPTSTECKPLQVKRQLEKTNSEQDKKMDQKMKDMEN